MGMYLENFKQSVNAMNVMKKSAILNYGSAKANKPGQTFETNEDVDKVFRRIDPSIVAPDLKIFDEVLAQMGRDATRLSNIVGGRGEPAAETLGEAEIAANQSSKGLTDYLQVIEDTFVQPVYDMRNQINMQFLDQEEVFMIVGESAGEWRTATPGQIRANVDFRCLSSGNENNKLVVTQQMINALDKAPLVQSMGFPVRADKMYGTLLEQGFGMSVDQVEELLPSLKAEKGSDEQESVDINNMLVQNMLIEIKLKGAMALAGAQGGVPGGSTPGPDAEPTTEGDAAQGLSEQSRTKV
jgi:hypothetical protein